MQFTSDGESTEESLIDELDASNVSQGFSAFDETLFEMTLAVYFKFNFIYYTI